MKSAYFRLTLIAILLVTLLASWASPGAGLAAISNAPGSPLSANEGATLKLIVNNRTGFQVTIRLSGAHSYSLTTPKGKSTFDILPGTYTYEYSACGLSKSGTLKITTRTKFNTDMCKTIKFSVVNRTNRPVTLVLQGRARYVFSFDFPPLDARILPGVYQYKIYTACGSESGSVNLMGGRRYATDCSEDNANDRILDVFRTYGRR